jgi:hypothetical protein
LCFSITQAVFFLFKHSPADAGRMNMLRCTRNGKISWFARGFSYN